MAMITIRQIPALIVMFFTILSCIFGYLAYWKMPNYGTPVTSKDGVTCKFSYDPTVPVMGYLSFAFFAAFTVTGCLFLFYLGRSDHHHLPRVLVRSTAHSALIVIIILFLTGLTAFMLLWTTIMEQNHTSHNVGCYGSFHNHTSHNNYCPTASCYYPSAAFVSLALGLFWCFILCLLAGKARQEVQIHPYIEE